MTTRIINYFKIYAKYDKQQHIYYINNLKTVFEHYYKFNEDNEKQLLNIRSICCTLEVLKLEISKETKLVQL